MEVTVDIVCDGCLLVGHSAPLRCHVLGWDDTQVVCGAQRSRGEVHLCMLPVSELPHTVKFCMPSITPAQCGIRCLLAGFCVAMGLLCGPVNAVGWAT